MLYWDLCWEAHETRVSDLQSSECFQLALGCIADVIHLLNKMKLLKPEPLMKDRLNESLINLWEEETIGWFDWLETEIQECDLPGLYDLAMSVITLSSSDSNECEAGIVFETMSYCYQVFLDIEVISTLSGPTIEDKIQEMERNSQICIQCIDQQLNLLSEIQCGHYTAPTLPPKLT